MSSVDAPTPLDALHEARALLTGIEHDGAREAVEAIDRALASFPEEGPTGMRVRAGQLTDDLELLDVVTHDLKDPLSAILMGSGYLLKSLPEDLANARVRKMAAAIQRSAERMNRLVRNLLELARMERGRLVLARSEHDMSDVIDRARRKIEPFAAEKDVLLEVRVQGAARLDVDLERVSDAILQLGTNAVRYTPAGQAVLLAARAQDGEVVVEVTDRGPGIAGERLEHLFERAYHMRRSPRDGTGIGLAIARGVVEAHGGVLRLASTSPTGSTFAITLPRPT
jgi:signal transduction histidine kinase